jgi:flagellar basal-body rod protein FlgG
MIRGLYTSALGLMKEEKKMDVISNNLANSNTTAYKADTTVFQTFDEVLIKKIKEQNTGRITMPDNIGTLNFGSDVGLVYTDYSQGTTQTTNNQLDFAISGDEKAFFTINVPQDDGTVTQKYTRDGSFKLDSDGKLVTRDGYSVVGKNGEIYLDSSSVSVAQDGSIIQNDESIDQFSITRFEDTDILTFEVSNTPCSIVPFKACSPAEPSEVSTRLSPLFLNISVSSNLVIEN